MSQDEQMVAIGKLVTERAAARRELALLARRIKDAGSSMSYLGNVLARDSARDLNEVTRGVDRLVSLGGLDGINKDVRDHQAIERRIAELSNSLKEAGAE
jgi:hypothetical protein